jgi:hypothetical protein
MWDSCGVESGSRSKEAVVGDLFEVRIECMECHQVWFIDVSADTAYEVEGQIADHEHHE